MQSWLLQALCQQCGFCKGSHGCLISSSFIASISELTTIVGLGKPRILSGRTRVNWEGFLVTAKMCSVLIVCQMSYQTLDTSCDAHRCRYWYCYSLHFTEAEMKGGRLVHSHRCRTLTSNFFQSPSAEQGLRLYLHICSASVWMGSG